MGRDVESRSVKSPAGTPPQRQLIAAAFEHVAFPVGLGFVAGPVLGLSLVAGLLMPMATTPDDATVAVVGSMMLFAMAIQNTVMRLILNNLPPTTIMTGNITHIVVEGVRWAAGFGPVMMPFEAATLAHRAQRIGLALASFAVGAVAGEIGAGACRLCRTLAPIAALLMLIPIGREELRASANF